MIYEAFIPVTDSQARQFRPSLFRDAHRELADQFGFVFNWSVYRPVHATEDEVTVQEYVRFQASVPDAVDFHLAIFA